MKLEKTIRGSVTFTNHSKVVIKGKYAILIKLKNESHRFIGDVSYISTMKNNILSLGQLLEKGYGIKMKYHTLTLLDIKGAIIAKVTVIKKKILLNIKMDISKFMCEE